jgi:predicted metalloprotease with PDZ domain
MLSKALLRVSSALAFFAAPALQAQARPAATPAQSAPITNVRYTLAFDKASAAARIARVTMSFDVASAAPVLLTLPVWTPGAYEVSNFARNVQAFDVKSGTAAVSWDKTTPTTWRVRPGTARSITVSFDFHADSLDNAMAWSTPDFLMINGTNIFLYPEGRSLDFPATVTVKAESGWKVATGMQSAGQWGTYREANYHDLVDMPFFIGNFDLDSMQFAGKWNRLATYPAGKVSGEPRRTLWEHIGKMLAVQSGVFGEAPFANYTTMMIFPPEFGGGSALEHQSSHVGIYNEQFIGSPILSLITGHEMFHAWNVKRLRPADLVPYHYSDAQPTPWLWVSEGITDYYADLTLVRSGIVPQSIFLNLANSKIESVNAVPAVALEDASLNIWIHPVDGTDAIYYPKGSLAGMLLDVMIRDASDNRNSLDSVLRELYTTTFKAGRGFTEQDWWGTVSKQANAKDFTDFRNRYIDGREPFPFKAVMPLAGFVVKDTTIREARIGVQTEQQENNVRVTAIVPGSMAASAGIQAGDILLSVGDVKVADATAFGIEYREKYGRSPDGTPLDIIVKRGEQTVTLKGSVTFASRNEVSLEMDPAASPKAVRIRNGMLAGER